MTLNKIILVFCAILASYLVFNAYKRFNIKSNSFIGSIGNKKVLENKFFAKWPNANIGSSGNEIYRFIFPASPRIITLVSNKDPKRKIVYTYKFDDSAVNKAAPNDTKVTIIKAFEYRVDYQQGAKDSFIDFPKILILKKGAAIWAARQYINFKSGSYTTSMIFPLEISLKDQLVDGSKNEGSFMTLGGSIIAEIGINLSTKIGNFTNCIKLKKNDTYEMIACKDHGILEINIIGKNSMSYRLSTLEY